MEELNKEIGRSRLFVGLYTVFITSFFVFWFSLIQAEPLSDTVGEWGQFGDYIGGLLNPVVALFAFHWLTRSVKIQKEELSETKKALQESKEAQERQAETALAAARIQSLNIELNLIATELASWYSRRNSVMECGYNTGFYHPVIDENGDRVDPKEALAVINSKINDLKAAQSNLLSRIGEIQANMA